MQMELSLGAPASSLKVQFHVCLGSCAADIWPAGPAEGESAASESARVSERLKNDPADPLMPQVVSATRPD